jgi:hypothetical protein
MAPDDPKGILHDGTLVVTASRIANVRPRAEALEERMAAKAALSRTI